MFSPPEWWFCATENFARVVVPAETPKAKLRWREKNMYTSRRGGKHHDFALSFLRARIECLQRRAYGV